MGLVNCLRCHGLLLQNIKGWKLRMALKVTSPCTSNLRLWTDLFPFILAPSPSQPPFYHSPFPIHPSIPPALNLLAAALLLGGWQANINKAARWQHMGPYGWSCACRCYGTYQIDQCACMCSWVWTFCVYISMRVWVSVQSQVSLSPWASKSWITH